MRKRVTAGRIVGGALLLALAAYLVAVGLEKADKVGSGVAAVLALAALLAPHLLPARTFTPPARRVSASGAGAASVGGTSSAEVRTNVSGTVASGTHAVRWPPSLIASKKSRSSPARRSGNPPTRSQTSRLTSIDAVEGPRSSPPGRGRLPGTYVSAAQRVKNVSVIGS